jgi:hypothetical protein
MLGLPPHHDERALREWERNAGELAQHHAVVQQPLSSTPDRSIEPASNPERARTIQHDTGPDLGLGL